MTLGEKLRELRHNKKMTLQDVAVITGYSKALISRIENDSVSPSINSLVKFAEALDIKLYELFSAVEGRDPSIVKKKSRGAQTLSGGKVKVEGLSDGNEDNKLAPVLMIFDPGANISDGKLKTHGGEEWWHVLKGRLEAVVGENRYELGEGDSIYLNSSSPHHVRNPAKAKATALVLVMG
jgi:transcriptional regulator with XRE-family HTH domain